MKTFIVAGISIILTIIIVLTSAWAFQEIPTHIEIVMLFLLIVLVINRKDD